MKTRPNANILGFVTLSALLLGIGGCEAVLNALDDLGDAVNGDILVLVVNNTSGTVRPDIQFDENDDNLTAIITGIVGGNSLNMPDLAAGQFLQFQFACDELGLIFSDQSELRTILGNVDAERSTILTREDDFNCGDEIRFEFFGDRNSFSVLITVNGRIVD